MFGSAICSTGLSFGERDRSGVGMMSLLHEIAGGAPIRPG
jgi:hypothetical protein